MYKNHYKYCTENQFAAMSEDELLNKLEISRKHAKKGKVKEADEFIEEMKAKYDL